MIFKEALFVLEKFCPSASPSNSIDIDESDNKEDNGTVSDHSGDQGKGGPMPSKKRAKGETDEYVIIISSCFVQVLNHILALFFVEYRNSLTDFT